MDETFVAAPYNPLTETHVIIDAARHYADVGCSSNTAGESCLSPDYDKLPLRLLLVSSRAKNIQSMTRALLPNIIMVQYKFETSTLDGILGLIAQALGSRKVECIGLVFHANAGSIYICAEGEKVISCAYIVEQNSLRDFFLTLGQNHLDFTLANSRIDFLACPAADIIDGSIIAQEIESLFQPAKMTVGISPDLKGTGVEAPRTTECDKSGLSGELYFQMDILFGVPARSSNHSLTEYERIRVIGKGSFGRAVLCKRKDDGVLLVLKEINLLELKSAEKRQLALNEVAVLSKLEHPNIISYYDSFEQDGTLAIVMEYADGGSLSSYLKTREEKHKLMGEREALVMFEQIASAVSYLHSNLILHRDLKSANIFLMKNGTIKVGDFGISKIMGSLTQGALTIVGTPYYFSPEICENKPYNEKADIWAIGCIYFEIVNLGQMAFEGSNIPALANKIRKGQYEQIRGNYSTRFKNLIRDILQQDPVRRPTAKFLHATIRQLLGRFEKVTSDWEEDSATDQESRNRRVRSVMYGFDPKTLQLSPVDLPVKIRIQQVCLSASHRLVLTTEDPQSLVYGWGDNQYGQLATGDRISRITPTLISSLTETAVSQIAAGSGFSVFCTNGLVMTCGKAAYLGRGNIEGDYVKPTLVQNEDLISADIRSIACGPEHTVAVDKHGKVFSWGNGMDGRLGNGSEKFEYFPVLVKIPTVYRIRDVRCGLDNSVLIGENRIILAMGSNEYNKLNLNNRPNILVQMKLSKLKDFGSRVIDLSLGPTHTAFLLESGHVHMFGLNTSGQLGRPNSGKTQAQGCSIVRYLQEMTVIIAQCGDNYTLATTSDNTLYFWGARPTANRVESHFDAKLLTDYKTTRLETIMSRRNSEELCVSDNYVDAKIFNNIDSAAVDHPFAPSDLSANASSNSNTSAVPDKLPPINTRPLALSSVRASSCRQLWPFRKNTKTEVISDLNLKNHVEAVEEIVWNPIQILRFDSRNSRAQQSVGLADVVAYGKEIFVIVETTAPLPKRPNRFHSLKTKGTLYRKVRQSSACSTSSLYPDESNQMLDSSMSEIDSELETKVPTWIQHELERAEFIPAENINVQHHDKHKQLKHTRPVLDSASSSSDGDKNQKKPRSFRRKGKRNRIKTSLEVDTEKLEKLQREKEETANRLAGIEEEYKRQQQQQQMAKEREAQLQDEIKRLRQVLSQQQNQFQDHTNQMNDLQRQLRQLTSPYTNGTTSNNNDTGSNRLSRMKSRLCSIM